MATLIKKIKKGHAYWYAVECQRVNGKPRIVWQKYLGRVATLLKTLQTRPASKPKEVRVREFGAVAALLSIADELNIIDIIDKTISKRHQGPSIGQYLLLAAINRAIAPRSKLQIGKWYEKTMLKRLWKHSDSAFSSQRFWDAMNAVDEKDLAEIEKSLVERLLKIESLDFKTLLYDTTNFATFISSTNTRNTIAQRGHSKRKRSDLKIVGLALLVERHFGIPLFHESYAGNINDQTSFQTLCLSLIERCQQLSKGNKEVTLVFDKGNSHREAFSLLEHHGVHFISSLKRNQCPDLFGIEKDKMELLKGADISGMRVYRCQKEIQRGTKRTVIVCLSEARYSQDIWNLTESVTKASRKLDQEIKQLRRWKNLPSLQRKPTVSGLKNRIEKLMRTHHNIMDGTPLINIEIDKDKAGMPRLSYSLNHQELQERMEKRCGRMMLFTDLDSWSTEELIMAYRYQSKIEDVFRQMNNWDYLRWQPLHHWTDQKIRIHAFYCVMAVMLVSIVRKRLLEKGIKISMHELLEELSDVKEVLLLHPPLKKPAPPKVGTVYSRQNALQKKLFGALDLARWQVREG